MAPISTSLIGVIKFYYKPTTLLCLPLKQLYSAVKFLNFMTSQVVHLYFIRQSLSLLNLTK